MKLTLRSTKKRKEERTGSSAAGFRASDSLVEVKGRPRVDRGGNEAENVEEVAGFVVGESVTSYEASFIIMTKHSWAEEVNQILPLLNVFSLKHNTRLKRFNGPTFTLFIHCDDDQQVITSLDRCVFLNGIHEQQKLTSTFNSFYLTM